MDIWKMKSNQHELVEGGFRIWPGPKKLSTINMKSASVYRPIMKIELIVTE